MCYWFRLISIRNQNHHMSHLMTKLAKWSVRPAKTQISLGIHPVWSESLLCAQWVAKDQRCHHADNEDWSAWASAAQADPSLRWMHRSFCWVCHETAHMSYVIRKAAFMVRGEFFFLTAKFIHYLFVFLTSDGPHQWRDARKPRALLEDYCQTQHLTGPMFYGNNSCKVGTRVYKLTDFGKLQIRYLYCNIFKYTVTQKIVVIILKFEQCGSIIEYWVQKIQREWQTVKTLIRLLLDLKWKDPCNEKLKLSWPLFSSPEPLGSWWDCSTGRPLSSVWCMYVCMLSTFSNIFS